MKKATSRPLLLDVNVLLAIAWPNHQFHAVVLEWLRKRPGPWATCALTELGFIRLSSNPRVVGVTKSPREAASLLASLVADSRHVYFDALPSPASGTFLSTLESILGFQQLTDAYLPWLAKQKNAKLITFDMRLKALAADRDLVEILREDSV